MKKLNEGQRLFVDCSDTLILFNYRTGKHDPNNRLIDEIKKWKSDNPDSDIVVWSFIGKKIAEHLGNVFFQDVGYTAIGKSASTCRLIRPDDIVIDDDFPFPYLCPASIKNPLKWTYQPLDNPVKKVIHWIQKARK